jgi:sugar phosphate isomerase/epimerase
MSCAFSLAHLTVLELSPPDVVTTAAGAGYQYAGVRLLPSSPGGPAYDLMHDAAMLRETLVRIRDTGVGVFDLEIVRLNPETDVRSFLPFLETGQKLGARAVLVAGDDPEEARLTERFAAFCDIAAPFGLTADLEFMPWTHVPDLVTAMRVVGAAARPNGGILVDALHFDRSHSRAEDLPGLPREWLHYAQLCDAPAEYSATTEALIHTARAERLFPGEGGIDLARILCALPRDLPISLEVPTLTLAKHVPAVERARRALDGARRVLAKTYGEPISASTERR